MAKVAKLINGMGTQLISSWTKCVEFLICMHQFSGLYRLYIELTNNRMEVKGTALCSLLCYTIRPNTLELRGREYC